MRFRRSVTISGGSPHARYTSTWDAAMLSAAGDAPPKYTGGAGSGTSRVVAPATL